MVAVVPAFLGVPKGLTSGWWLRVGWCWLAPCQPPVLDMDATLKVTCAFSAELRVEVEPPTHQMPREGSSSEYSSSSSSPMGVQAREESSDSAEETDRRKAPA